MYVNINAKPSFRLLYLSYLISLSCNYSYHEM